MTFTCPHCKAAPIPAHGYRRSWKWKTQRGFDNHKCAANEEQIERGAILHPDRNNGKVPDWLQGPPLSCPHCHRDFGYSGPQAASLHFPCPLCKKEVQFVCIGDWETAQNERVCSLCKSPMIERSGKFGVFWGCSAYSRSNPCKGKSMMTQRTIIEDVLALEAFSEGAGLVYEDAQKVERKQTWMERRNKHEQHNTSKERSATSNSHRN